MKGRRRTQRRSYSNGVPYMVAVHHGHCSKMDTAYAGSGNEAEVYTKIHGISNTQIRKDVIRLQYRKNGYNLNITRRSIYKGWKERASQN